MYSAAVHIDEMYPILERDEKRLKDILAEAGVKEVYQDEKTGWNYFLFLHPKQRDRAYQHLKKHFKSAIIVRTPAFVDIDDLTEKHGGK